MELSKSNTMDFWSPSNMLQADDSGLKCASKSDMTEIYYSDYKEAGKQQVKANITNSFCFLDTKENNLYDDFDEFVSRLFDPDDELLRTLDAFVISMLINEIQEEYIDTLAKYNSLKRIAFRRKH